MIEEERRDVVIVDDEQDVGLLIGQPLLYRPEGVEDRLPHRVVLLAAVVGEANGRRM
jgi:hypothetical protein